MYSSPLILFGLVCLTTFVSFANSEEPLSPARLLVEKKVLNKYLVETKDILVHYNIYNTGERSAVNVNVNDAAFSLNHFDIVGGALKFNINKIPAQSNTTHTVVVRSKENVWGRFNFTAGEVSYLTEGSNEIQSGFTSEPGEGFIVSLVEFEKRFSPHYADWGAFLLISLSTVVFPYLLWNSSRSKYEALSTKKSK